MLMHVSHTHTRTHKSTDTREGQVPVLLVSAREGSLHWAWRPAPGTVYLQPLRALLWQASMYSFLYQVLMFFPTELVPPPLHLVLKQLFHVAQAGLQLSTTHLTSASNMLQTCFNGKMATQSLISWTARVEADEWLFEYTLICVWSLASIPNIQWFQAIIS